MLWKDYMYSSLPAQNTKRANFLKEAVEGCEKYLGSKNLSKTRWTARAQSIAAINTSYEADVTTLSKLTTLANLDTATKVKALGLYKKMCTFDFLVCMFFLKNVMYKIKILTETLETLDLNVIDAITIIESTVGVLEKINSNDEEMDLLLESCTTFAIKNGIDPDQEFQRHHRKRVKPRQQDDGGPLADLTLKLFYRKEFKVVLDTLCSGLRDNTCALRDAVGPLSRIFLFPLNKNI